MSGGVTKIDGNRSLGADSAIDTPLVQIHVGEAHNRATSANCATGDLTTTPRCDARGALTWLRHGSSDQPDVAVKANDHEQLVAILVQVLPRLQPEFGRLRDVRCWSAPVTHTAIWSVAKSQPERSAHRRPVPCPSNMKCRGCNLLCKDEIFQPATLGASIPSEIPVVGAAAAMESERSVRPRGSRTTRWQPCACGVTHQRMLTEGALDLRSTVSEIRPRAEVLRAPRSPSWRMHLAPGRSHPASR